MKGKKKHFFWILFSCSIEHSYCCIQKKILTDSFKITGGVFRANSWVDMFWPKCFFVQCYNIETWGMYGQLASCIIHAASAFLGHLWSLFLCLWLDPTVIVCEVCTKRPLFSSFVNHASFSAITSYQYVFYFHKYDICIPLRLTFTDMLTFFSVPLNPLTSSASLDQLVEYEPFIKPLYFL